jgi:hypothetical protein
MPTSHTNESSPGSAARIARTILSKTVRIARKEIHVQEHESRHARIEEGDEAK